MLSMKMTMTKMTGKEKEKTMPYKFTAPRTLAFPVYDNKKCVLPKGTPNVEIAFGASSKTYVDKATGKTRNQNVYRWNGKIYNA